MALILSKSKKSQAFMWLGIIALIVIMGLIYIILDQPWDKVSEISKTNFTGTQYEPTYKKIHTVWDYFLVLFLLAILAFGILTVMRKRNETY